MTPASETVLRVAVPSPLYQLFDYLPPAGELAPAPGTRVRVPFGRRELVGLVLAHADTSEVSADKLRRVREILDPTAAIAPAELALARWAADYYHQPPGELVSLLLPPLLRGDRSSGQAGWRTTAQGRTLALAELDRAPRQRHLLEILQAGPEGVADKVIEQAAGPGWRGPMRQLAAKGLAERVRLEAAPPLAHAAPHGQPPELNPGQADAVAAILAQTHEFAPFLLDGVTGSGKTEVYLHVLEAVIAKGRQALVLVPEIGLTPQLVERFRARLSGPIVVYHSGLGESERLHAWEAMRNGDARVLIGTRSAVFLPIADLGLIVVDEEHDSSFKQQEGFRYSGRDVAVMRARLAGVPIVLGSATPALESLANAEQGRYRHLHLPERAGTARHPRMQLLDIRSRPMFDGISDLLLDAVGRHLDSGGQVLLFLNRRGFAPALICHDCGSIAECRRCDARMTLHQRRQRLICHHCGAERPIPRSCPDCGSADLRATGQGTERLEQVLAERFPEVGIARIDRDTTQRKGALERLLRSVHSGASRILIGTQMLAKGHDFPEVSLVGVLDGDQGLFGVDFRAGERMAQLITQVAGRAGRAERPGEVLIQTHHPDHPALRLLIARGYPGFSEAMMAERRVAELPPFAALALLRAEAAQTKAPEAFLLEARALAEASGSRELMLLGPAPAPMERRAGRYRMQLLLQASNRAPLQALLDLLIPRLAALPAARGVRWSIDVDPQDMF